MNWGDMFVKAMKVSAIALLAGAMVGSVWAQPDLEWERTYGGARDDYAAGLTQAADGGYALVGWTLSFGDPHSMDGWAIRVAANGDSLWAQRCIGEGLDDIFMSAHQLAEGGFVFGGTTQDAAGAEQFWLVESDSGGEIGESHAYYGPNGAEIYCRSFIPTAEGGYCLAGKAWYNNEDSYLILLDRNGDVVWSKHFNQDGDQQISAVIQTEDGGFALAARSEIFWEMSANLIKLDSDGNEEWTCSYGREGQDFYFLDVAQSFDGGFVAVGNMGAVTIDDQGNVVETCNFNGDGIVNVDQILRDDAGYVMYGEGNDQFLFRADPQLELVWSLKVDGLDYCGDFISTLDGGFALIGSEENRPNNEDFKLIKIGADPVLGVPRWVSLPDTGFAEDDSLVLDLAFLYDHLTDLNDPDSLLSITAESGENVFADFDGERLLITAESNWWGLDSIRLTVADPDSFSSSCYLHVKVTSVNDPPLPFTLLFPPDSSEATQLEMTFLWAEATQNPMETDSVRYQLYFRTPEYAYELPPIADRFYLVNDLRDILEALQPGLQSPISLQWGVRALDSDSATLCQQDFTLNINLPQSASGGSALPLEFALTGVHPNPFNATAVVGYRLSVDGWASLQLYDLSGRLVQTLVDGRQGAGRYQAVWNAQDHAAGVYIIRLQAGGRTASEKMVLVR